MKRMLTSGTVVAAVLLLAGCVAPPSPFNGERTGTDELPAVFSNIPLKGDATTSRYQGDADGHSLYLVKGTGEYQFCLAYTDGTKEGSGVSCSGGTWAKTTLPDRAEFVVQLNGFPGKSAAGEKQISNWVRQTVGGSSA